MPRLPPNPARSDLVRRRRYRADRMAKAEAMLVRWRAEVVRLDAAIEAKGGPKRAYKPILHPAPRGGIAKVIFDTLRQAGEPMRASEIVAAVARQEWAAQVTLPVLKKRVRIALERQAANGTLRRVKGARRAVAWLVA